MVADRLMNHLVTGDFLRDQGVRFAPVLYY